MPYSTRHIGRALGNAARQAARERVVLVLVAVGLITRLHLLSMSLDEVDSANFYNALTYGYDITFIRPHAPGYSVYVFMG